MSKDYMRARYWVVTKTLSRKKQPFFKHLFNTTRFSPELYGISSNISMSYIKKYFDFTFSRIETIKSSLFTNQPISTSIKNRSKQQR